MIGIVQGNKRRRRVVPRVLPLSPLAAIPPQGMAVAAGHRPLGSSSRSERSRTSSLPTNKCSADNMDSLRSLAGLPGMSFKAIERESGPWASCPTSVRSQATFQSYRPKVLDAPLKMIWTDLARSQRIPTTWVVDDGPSQHVGAVMDHRPLLLRPPARICRRGGRFPATSPRYRRR